MTQDLPQEVLSRLDALAAELGQTVEYLWPAAVQHTWATALTGVLAGAFGFVLLGIAGLVVRRCCREDDWPEGATEGATMFSMVLGVVGLTVAPVLFIYLPDLLAPEGATIKALLK